MENMLQSDFAKKFPNLGELLMDEANYIIRDQLIKAYMIGRNDQLEDCINVVKDKI